MATELFNKLKGTVGQVPNTWAEIINATEDVYGDEVRTLTWMELCNRMDVQPQDGE